MDLNIILNEHPNVQIVVSVADLKQAFDEWQSEFYRQLKNSEQQEYLTTDEVAKILNCDQSTLWRWDKNGYLPKVKWCGKTRYRLSDVKKVMEGE